MQRYLISRLVQSFLILFGVLVMVFFMVRLTGDPVTMMIGREATTEEVEIFREELGFNRPLIVQLGEFAWNGIRGDFGNSSHYNLPALPLILERLPATIQLALASLTLSIVIGIPLGLIAGSSPGSIWDTIARTLGLLAQSTPSFWLALLLIILFAVNLGWFPSFGRDEAKSVVLPAFALGVFSIGQFVRLTRSAVLEIRGEDFIRTAASKGLSPRIIYVRHVLRNASIALISIMGVQLSYLLSGSIYIETIFSWPGIGRLLADSIGVRDFPMIQAIAFFTSLAVVALSLLTDIVYALVDPRIRYGS